MGSGEDDDWGCWSWGETGDGTGGENTRLGFDGIVGPGSIVQLLVGFAQ